MPRNTKMSSSYASVSDDPDALDFRAIADELTELGHPMGCSTARNYLVSGLMKIAAAIASHYGVSMSDHRASMVARSPEFQMSMRMFLQDDAVVIRASQAQDG